MKSQYVGLQICDKNTINTIAVNYFNPYKHWGMVGTVPSININKYQLQTLPESQDRKMGAYESPLKYYANIKVQKYIIPSHFINQVFNFINSTFQK